MTKEEMETALSRFREVKELLSRFPSREEAAAYLAKETGLPQDECRKACDFLAECSLDSQQISI